MDDRERIKQIEELVADHKIIIHELKTMNLHLQAIVMIDRRRLEILEMPWWKRWFQI